MLIYVTSIWNHYQGPLCYALADRLGADSFRALFVRPNDDAQTLQRIRLGWDVRPPVEKWIVANPQTQAELDAENSMWVKNVEEADIAILAALHWSRPLYRAVRRRILAGRLTFFVNERFFKDRLTFKDIVNPKNWVRWMKMHYKYNFPNVHYLPISHFGQDDLKMLRTCSGRMWRWAYFPELSDKLSEKPRGEIIQIGWCGRMLKWKHVEIAIEAVAALPMEDRDKCHLTIVGTGECENELRNMVASKKLTKWVDFKPPMTVPEIADFMRGLDIYLLPSDRGEGWGVVLAEAMNKGCVPIACDEAGATLELIQDGFNGYVHKKGDVAAIASRISGLIRNRARLEEMGKAAFESIRNWDAKVGASRLLMLIDSIRKGSAKSLYSSGLCSNVG